MSELLEAEVGNTLLSLKATVAVAESCTGGLISHRLTNMPGSSAYFEMGIVVYSNTAKMEFLGIDKDILKLHGAVSSRTAELMAHNIRMSAGTTFGLAVTGIAGPGGGTLQKPVGLVFIAVSGNEVTEVNNFRFSGSRTNIKERAADAALSFLLSKMKNS